MAKKSKSKPVSKKATKMAKSTKPAAKAAKVEKTEKVKAPKTIAPVAFMLQLPSLTFVANTVDLDGQQTLVLQLVTERKLKNALLKATRALKSNARGLDGLEVSEDFAEKKEKKEKPPKGKKEEEEEVDFEEEDEEEDEEEEEEDDEE